MKRTALAVLAAAFASTAFAATTVPAPTMPSDFTAPLKKKAADSCKRPDGTVISRTHYDVKKVSSSLYTLVHIAKNGESVAYYDGPRVFVKQSDGSWLLYDRQVKRAVSTVAIQSIIGLSPREYIECAQ